jgi:hypothetical protein
MRCFDWELNCLYILKLYSLRNSMCFTYSRTVKVKQHFWLKTVIHT